MKLKTWNIVQYTIELGKIDKSETEKNQYQDEITVLFGMLKESAEHSDVWDAIKDKFLDYSTNKRYAQRW